MSTKQGTDPISQNDLKEYHNDHVAPYLSQGGATTNTTWYGTCITGASTTKKNVTILSPDIEFTLVAGNSIKVLFTYNNTATSPTLAVGNLTATTIKGFGTTKPDYWWKAGDVVEFVYDGTNWLMLPSQGQINALKSALLKGIDTTNIIINDSAGIPTTHGTYTPSVDCFAVISYKQACVFIINGVTVLNTGTDSNNAQRFATLPIKAGQSLEWYGSQYAAAFVTLYGILH